MNQIKSIVIVGGGSAGWLTAGTIAAKHQTDDGCGITVTLVESPNIPTIGVGEGTWPTMRRTLEKMGISETEFFKHCHAGFKQGANFVNWVTGKPGDNYYHPLVLPQGFIEQNLVPHWQSGGHSRPFADMVCAQESLCEAGLAPKQITTPEYAGIENYAYHLDAGAFTQFLTKHCTEKLGVKHVLDDVTGIEAHENGDIARLNLKHKGAIEGDLFVDCTGFNSLLLGKHYGVPFVPKGDILFVDTALAIQVPYENDQSPIASHTISTAQSAGWVWDIGLSSRRGVGLVYSSSHISQDKAEEELTKYVRTTAPHMMADLEFRKIPINSGHRERFWVNNCVAVGLSAGFLEPLEASALVMIELASQMIAEQLPVTRAAMDIVAKRFNNKFLYRWDRIIDFLKLHYVLSQRTDSAFWLDNRDPATMPDSLKELLELWQYQYPWHDDFVQKDEVFPSASYQYVLYGMGFKTAPSHISSSSMAKANADQHFKQNDMRIEQLMKAMPTNRDLIAKIHQYGMQRI